MLHALADGLPIRSFARVAGWYHTPASVAPFYGGDDHVRVPSLFVHADGCAFPDHVRQVHARVKGPKALVWSEGTQIDFYDQPAQVGTAVRAVTQWFAETLGAPTGV